jgi:hypothetical protein
LRKFRNFLQDCYIKTHVSSQQYKRMLRLLGPHYVIIMLYMSNQRWAKLLEDGICKYSFTYVMTNIFIFDLVRIVRLFWCAMNNLYIVLKFSPRFMTLRSICHFLFIWKVNSNCSILCLDSSLRRNFQEKFP